MLCWGWRKLSKISSRQWKYLFIGVVAVDVLIVGLIFYVFMTPNSIALSAALPAGGGGALMPRVVIITPTPWPGPGSRPTPTPTLPPTPLATDVLAESGFPPGFTPTPRPTRSLIIIPLPYVYPVGGRGVDVPVINQIHYPEPFFPPGSNNACGPVALFAGLLGLGLEVDYSHLRDIAVNNGFAAAGISKRGLVNTAATLNSEWGYPLTLEHGNLYNTQNLIKELRQGGVVIVLVRVKKENGQYRVTGSSQGSVEHFLLVEQINLDSKKVKMAGSTLGMDEVPLSDFIESWTGNHQAVVSTEGWASFLKNEEINNWALILKRTQ